jgi:serine protease AprX
VGPNGGGVVKADIAALGESAMIFDGNGGIIGGSGTSFAVPQIAGWVACLRQAKPTASIYAIRRAIIKSAHLYPSVDTNNQIGYGVPDFGLAAKYLGINADTDTVNTNNFVYIYPNPVTDKDELKMLVSSNVAQKMQAALFDVSGKKLWTSENQLTQGRQYVTVQLPLRLPAGVYFLKPSAPARSRL